MSYLTNTLFFALRSSAGETKNSAPRMLFLFFCFQIVLITRTVIQFILQHALQVKIARSLRIRRWFVGVIPVQ